MQLHYIIQNKEKLKNKFFKLDAHSKEILSLDLNLSGSNISYDELICIIDDTNGYLLQSLPKYNERIHYEMVLYKMQHNELPPEDFVDQFIDKKVIKDVNLLTIFQNEEIDLAYYNIFIEENTMLNSSLIAKYYNVYDSNIQNIECYRFFIDTMTYLEKKEYFNDIISSVCKDSKYYRILLSYSVFILGTYGISVSINEIKDIYKTINEMDSNKTKDEMIIFLELSMLIKQRDDDINNKLKSLIESIELVEQDRLTYSQMRAMSLSFTSDYIKLLQENLIKRNSSYDKIVIIKKEIDEKISTLLSNLDFIKEWSELNFRQKAKILYFSKENYNKITSKINLAEVNML